MNLLLAHHHHHLDHKLEIIEAHEAAARAAGDSLSMERERKQKLLLRLELLEQSERLIAEEQERLAATMAAPRKFFTPDHQPKEQKRAISAVHPAKPRGNNSIAIKDAGSSQQSIKPQRTSIVLPRSGSSESDEDEERRRQQQRQEAQTRQLLTVTVAQQFGGDWDLVWSQLVETHIELTDKGFGAALRRVLGLEQQLSQTAAVSLFRAIKARPLEKAATSASASRLVTSQHVIDEHEFTEFMQAECAIGEEAKTTGGLQKRSRLIIQALAGIWKSDGSLFHEDDDHDHHHHHNDADMEVLSLSRPSSSIALGEESKDNHRHHHHHHHHRRHEHGHGHGHHSNKKKKKRKSHNRNKVAPAGVVQSPSMSPDTSPASRVKKSRVSAQTSTTAVRSNEATRTTKVHPAQPQV